MGIRFLSRSDYCSLAGLEVEQFNVLRRRDQVPSVPNLDLTEEVANERGYEASGALLLTIANELVERYEMSRECAARIAACGRIMFTPLGGSLCDQRADCSRQRTGIRYFACCDRLAGGGSRQSDEKARAKSCCWDPKGNR